MLDIEDEECPESDEWSPEREEPISAVEVWTSSNPVVADSSAPLWIKYCEDRLKHFAIER